MKDMLHWIFASMAAGISLVVGAYGIFDTRNEAKDRHVQLEKHMDQRFEEIKRAIDQITKTNRK